MPSAVWVPGVAITASGREIEFPILGYICHDLRAHGHITFEEYSEMHYWIESYRSGGAMPGLQRFRSPFTNEMVYFVHLLDDLLEMWQIASNWADLTDDEDDQESLTGEEDIDLYRPWPHDIGRVCLFARFSWVQ